MLCQGVHLLLGLRKGVLGGGGSSERGASVSRGRSRDCEGELQAPLPGAHGRRLRGRLADMAPPVPLCLLLAPPAAHMVPTFFSMRTLCSPECMSLHGASWGQWQARVQVGVSGTGDDPLSSWICLPPMSSSL